MEYILWEKNYNSTKWHKVGAYKSLYKAKHVKEKRKKIYEALTSSQWIFKILEKNKTPEKSEV